MKVLCAWEFGGDLGHISRLVPIARELRAMGHSVSLAFRDSARLADATLAGFEVFAAPLLRPPAQANPSPVSFSQILLNVGFDDRPGLAGALRAWRSLFELAQPDVVVSDYAPTALVAARAARLRRVSIGTGFSQPPAAEPLPALRAWQPVEKGVLQALDDRVLNAVRASMKPGEAPPRAADIFEADTHLLCTFPELDPFGTRSAVEYVGAQGSSDIGIEVDWDSQPGLRVFAYLKPRDARFAAVLDGLRATGGQAIVAAPGLDEVAAARASGGRIRVLGAPAKLGRLLPQADLCVFHAGPGVAARALAAGVPMALLPMQLEQFLIARRLRDAGVAELAAPDDPVADFGAWFTRLAQAEALRANARRLAQAHAGHSFEAASRLAAERIARTAEGG